MPTISLRLTEVEYEALKQWALGSQRSMQREIIFRLFAGDLPKHVTKAITEVETKLTADAREATGRDVTVEFDLTPATPRAPGKCQYDTPVGTKCKMCGQVHKA